MEQNPGNNPPSGSETPETKPKKKPRRSSSELSKLKAKVKELEQENQSLKQQLEKTKQSVRQMELVGWDDRNLAKLRILENFYRRMVNIVNSQIQVKSEHLNGLIEEAQHTLKDQVRK